MHVIHKSPLVLRDWRSVWKLKDGYFDKLDLPVGGSPVFEDMDFDGDLDMVIGTEKGTLVYFRNTGR